MNQSNVENMMKELAKNLGPKGFAKFCNKFNLTELEIITGWFKINSDGEASELTEKELNSLLKREKLKLLIKKDKL